MQASTRWQVMGGVVAGVSVFLLLFDVSVAPRWQLPTAVQRPDTEQEARYQQCFDERDARIHEEAFGTIDNPDVQREFISMHRDNAEQACRKEFPQKQVTVERPLEINLVDLDFRYN